MNAKEYVSKTSAMERMHGYLNIYIIHIFWKRNRMIEHFTNTAVYAVAIGEIIGMTVEKFHWKQNIILFLNGGATAIMHMEIWKRFLMARDEVFKTKDEKLMKAKTVQELKNEEGLKL